MKTTHNSNIETLRDFLSVCAEHKADALDKKADLLVLICNNEIFAGAEDIGALCAGVVPYIDMIFVKARNDGMKVEDAGALKKILKIQIEQAFFSNFILFGKSMGQLNDEQYQLLCDITGMKIPDEQEREDK